MNRLRTFDERASSPDTAAFDNTTDDSAMSLAISLAGISLPGPLFSPLLDRPSRAARDCPLRPVGHRLLPAER